MWLLLLACADRTVHPQDDVLRWNDAVAKGTHNSYHVQSDGVTMEELAYTHAPLEVQLDEQGVRHFELDIDRADGVTFRVRHIAVIDEGSHCPTLAECLGTIDAWSAAHPGHGPVLALLEVKEAVDADEAGAWLDALDQVVSSSLAPERLLTPDRVRGDAADLQAAIEAGWPTLGEVRGQVMIVLYDRSLRGAYTRGETSLSARPMFPMSEGEASRWSAFDVLDDPTDPAIAAQAAAGRLIRTRADGWPDPDPERGVAALASGAQWISTDFPVPSNGVDYEFQLGGEGAYLCNPITAAASCTSLDLEDPERLAP